MAVSGPRALTDRERADQLFHRQLVLLAAAVTVLAICVGIALVLPSALEVSADRMPRSRTFDYGGATFTVLERPESPRWLTAALVGGSAAIVLLFSVALVHTARVAAFAFRPRGDH